MLVQILSEKMLLEPVVMKDYFNSLFLIKSKTQLTENMENFINKAAFLGFTNFDMKKLTLALRVLYPIPSEANTKLILNYLMLLSLSGSYYKEFEDKSIAYIERCLDVVEEHYKGKKSTKIAFEDDTTKSIEIDYFDKIETNDKIYNKK